MRDLWVMTKDEKREMDRRIHEFEEQFAAKCKQLCPPRWRPGMHSQDDEPAVMKFVLAWDDEQDYREDMLGAIRHDHGGRSFGPIIARAKREALAGDPGRMIELLKDAQANGYARLLAGMLFVDRYIERPKKKYKPRQKKAKVQRSRDYADKYAGEGICVDRRDSSLLPDAEYKCMLYRKFLMEVYRDKQSKANIKELALNCAVAKFRSIQEGAERTLTKHERAKWRKKTVTEESLRTYMGRWANARHRITPKPKLDDVDLGLHLAQAELH